jgi:hypothetical protein
MSVLAALSTGAWWWVTWPERAIRTVDPSQIDADANSYEAFICGRNDHFDAQYTTTTVGSFIAYPRSVGDVLRGRQLFGRPLANYAKQFVWVQFGKVKTHTFQADTNVGIGD